jgi:hypothetical protein
MTITSLFPRLVMPALVVALVAGGCGNDSPSSVDVVASPTATVPDEGGFGAPAAAPDEFPLLPGMTMTGTAELAPNGCWYLSGNGESALLIGPTGTTLGEDGATLVTAEGIVVADGTRLDTTGGLVGLTELPGGADGRWGNYAAFCDPTYGYAVVADVLDLAFDPAAVDPDALAAELGASVFDTDYGCGFGFTTGDADGRWALYVEVTTATPPAAGPVSLPDERFDVSVTAGAHLFVNHCDDVAEWFEPDYTPALEWAVSAGEFTYPETSGEICAGEPPQTITLTGATVDTPAGPVVLDPIEITNTSFGCFAG